MIVVVEHGDGLIPAVQPYLMLRLIEGRETLQNWKFNDFSRYRLASVKILRGVCVAWSVVGIGLVECLCADMMFLNWDPRAAGLLYDRMLSPLRLPCIGVVVELWLSDDLMVGVLEPRVVCA